MTTSRATPYTRIAIACQGGGSHCAYTAGVLSALLQRTRSDADRRLVLGERYEIVGLTGTSGGAISAYLAWTDLLRLQQNQPLQGPFAVERFWESMKARLLQWPPSYPPTGLLANGLQLALAHLEGIVPMLSPTPNPLSALAQQAFGAAIRAAACGAGDEPPHPVGPPWPPGTLARSGAAVRLPVLMIGAANIDDAEYAPFLSTPDRGPKVEQLLASAALSEIFPAVEVEAEVSAGAKAKRAASGPMPRAPRPPRYWDGLLSQNPPLRDLLSLPMHQRPQEIWIIRINPATLQGSVDPLAQARLELSPAEIRDRRNELAGNLSLEQEKRFIREINRLLALQRPALESLCQHVDLYGIALEGPWDLPEHRGRPDGDWLPDPGLERPALLGHLDAASKLNRLPAFIDALTTYGMRCAAHFLQHHPVTSPGRSAPPGTTPSPSAALPRRRRKAVAPMP